MSISEGACGYCPYRTADSPEVYLTKREKDCFKLFMYGASLKEIGLELCISRRTAETHYIHIREKMSLPSGSRYQFVKKAIDLNLAQIEVYH